MNTFLPYASFSLSAACLDRARLGKQRIEVVQILKALREGGAWARHPAVLMWDGCERALAAYGMACCSEWIDRGYRDTCLEQLSVVGGELVLPRWFGDYRLHQSHRSNLMRKNPEHYAQFKWGVGPELPYFWPTKEGYT